MQTSDNYEMNLPEGTDLVNLINDYNPNFETIDAEMFGNKIASIGTATELKSGTVHAITRNNSDVPVFRFVATSNWALGDQLTVDGVSVTALLPNGEALDDGAYVINANVLCILTGTVCTFIGAQGQISEAQDALRLGGELPAYYGTAADVQSATNIANAASTIANNVSTNLANNYYDKTYIDSQAAKRKVFVFDLDLAALTTAWGSMYYAYIDKVITGVTGVIKAAHATYISGLNESSAVGGTAFISVEYINNGTVRFIAMRPVPGNITGTVVLEIIEE